ncbi:MAG: solute-binding protein [Gammaproteobacteria bacterium]|nr:solute-binding protein [Gammaproteobacteria bacterium]
MIYSESVAQIVPFIRSGNIDLSIIPKSFVLQDALKDSGKYIPINPSWYQPVTQYVAVLQDNNPVTISFIEFLTSNHALNILNNYGYQYTGDR